MSISQDTFVHFAEFYLVCEMFQMKFAEKTKRYNLCSGILIENRAFYCIAWENMIQRTGRR